MANNVFQMRIGTTASNAKGYGSEGTTMITFPISSTYKTTSTTLVNAGRNSKGETIGTVVKTGIRKIEMSYKAITIEDYAKIGTFFDNDSNFYFYAYYYDQDRNAWQCRYCYVGDRVADAIQNIQWKDSNRGGLVEPKYIGNFKISIIDTGKGTF